MSNPYHLGFTELSGYCATVINHSTPSGEQGIPKGIHIRVSKVGMS
jgi:hypothetical protein